MHGGISPRLKTVNDIRRLERRVEPEEGTLLADLLWSDPSDDPSVSQSSPVYGCAGWRFGSFCLKSILPSWLLVVVSLTDLLASLFVVFSSCLCLYVFFFFLSPSFSRLVGFLNMLVWARVALSIIPHWSMAWIDCPPPTRIATAVSIYPPVQKKSSVSFAGGMPIPLHLNSILLPTACLPDAKAMPRL